ncbi:MAG: SDR family oxidoreductase [Gammaproteobacteria bacterium]|nr:SDR family oxidoreductase [Gammaproteobacteria bacterium]MCP5136659.1 SDR family oxidoreductase [Gammaproteobacteria bacterium]
MRDNRVFIVGCGYVGERVAAEARHRGREVFALARTPRSAQHLLTFGIEPVRGDLDDRGTLQDMPTDDATIYYFAPPPDKGDRDPRIGAFLDAIRIGQLPRRIVLISTSGVYGNCEGAWVDESWPRNPQVDRARRRSDAELQLERWAQAHGVAYAILRVPGIYGPDRVPLERLEKGVPVLAESESPWSNRIHVDDLAAACVAAGEDSRPGGVFNVADGQPSTMTDYFKRVARAAGLPPPPEISLDEARATLSPGMLSYLAESKRLDITRMREELGVEPAFADLDAALAHILHGHCGGGHH